MQERNFCWIEKSLEVLDSFSHPWRDNYKSMSSGGIGVSSNTHLSAISRGPTLSQYGANAAFMFWFKAFVT